MMYKGHFEKLIEIVIIRTQKDLRVFEVSTLACMVLFFSICLSEIYMKYKTILNKEQYESILKQNQKRSITNINVVILK